MLNYFGPGGGARRLSLPHPVFSEMFLAMFSVMVKDSGMRASEPKVFSYPKPGSQWWHTCMLLLCCYFFFSEGIRHLLYKLVGSLTS